MKKEILRFENLSKYNRGKQQFSDIEITICGGEMVGITSDNLRVLWILCEILKGEMAPDGGAIYVNHERKTFEEAKGILRKKVFFLSGLETYGKELTLLDLFYTADIKGPIRGRKKWMKQKVEEEAQKYDIPLPILDRKAYKLSALDNCRMAMLRAIMCGRVLVVLVDTSSFLNPTDYMQLMKTVASFERYGISFLMIDHIDNMLIRYTQRLIVLEDGMTRYILDEYTPENLEAVFHQKDKQQKQLENTEENHDQPVFLVQHLETDNFHGFHLSIRQGEIVGLVEPATYIAAELVDILKGKRDYQSGELYLNEEKWCPKNEFEAIHKGIVFVPENPVQSGQALLSDMTVMDNLLLTISEKHAGVGLHTYQKSVRMECEKFFGRDIADQKVDTLDLLDQQRLVFLRWILFYPSLIVVMHPFSGSNLYMMQVTIQMIRLCAQKNISVLVVANSASEANGVCDRTVFLN